MKYLTANGRFWIEQDGQLTKVGLTKESLEEYGVFLMFIPKVRPGANVNEGLSLAAVETINQLGCLPCPVSGTFVGSDGPAEEDPTSITENTALFSFIHATLPTTLIKRETYAMCFL